MNKFDVRANKWDNPLHLELATAAATQISEEIKEKRYKRALEFGCGTGLVSLLMDYDFDEIILMDSSEKMIDKLLQKIEKGSLTNMKPVIFDMTKENYPEKFDVIYLSMVLHHISDVENLINKFHNMLNPNGMLCIVDLDEEDGSFHSDKNDFDGYDGFSHDYLKSVLADTGFKNIKTKTFHHGTKPIGESAVPYSLVIASAEIE